MSLFDDPERLSRTTLLSTPNWWISRIYLWTWKLLFCPRQWILQKLRTTGAPDTPGFAGARGEIPPYNPYFEVVGDLWRCQMRFWMTRVTLVGWIREGSDEREHGPWGKGIGRVAMRVEDGGLKVMHVRQVIRKVSCLLFLCFLYFYCFFEGKKVKSKKVPTTFQKPTPLLFQYFFHAFWFFSLLF